jgi:hypothetical protein
MDIKAKFMFRAILGFAMGLMVDVFLITFTGDSSMFDNRIMILVQFLCSGLMGVVGMGGTIVYDIEDWGLGRATFTHYIITFITMLTLSEVLGWFPHSVLLIVFIAFTIIYALIWLFEYFVWKRQIR